MDEDYDYRFLISELKNCNEADICFIIEIMRSTEHAKSFVEMMNERAMVKQALNESEEFPEAQPSDIFLTNLMLAQFREALKLFGQFSKRDIYKLFYDSLSDEQRSNVDPIAHAVDEFEKKTGIIYDILKPHRDRVFHYDTKKVTEWISEIRQYEKANPPFIQSLDPEKFDFYMGVEYDIFLHTNSLSNDVEQDNEPSAAMGRNEIFDLQHHFLHFAVDLGMFLMDSNNIKKGEKLSHLHRFMRDKDLKHL